MWNRVPDNEVLELERSEVCFGFPGGEYSLIWNPAAQHSLEVAYCGSRETWHLFLRESAGSDVKLCGMADWVPEILGDVCWFEFVISDQPTITYWGNQVIYRQDVAAAKGG